MLPLLTKLLKKSRVVRNKIGLFIVDVGPFAEGHFDTEKWGATARWASGIVLLSVLVYGIPVIGLAGTAVIAFLAIQTIFIGNPIRVINYDLKAFFKAP